MKHINLVISSAVVSVAAVTSAQALDVNMTVWSPEGHPLSEGYQEWAAELESASNGDINPTVFLGEVLLPAAGHLSGLGDGIAQIGYHAGTYTPSDLPEDNTIAQLAFNYSNPWVAAFATTEASFTIPALQDMWARNNVVFLSGYSIPTYHLVCNRHIETAADLEGVKVRVPGAAWSDWAKLVGMVPVNVSITELYGGLDKGQLDCAAIAANELKSRSIWDVAKHVHLIDLGVYFAGYLHAANADFWRDMTPEQRDVFWDTLPANVVGTVAKYVESSSDALTESSAHGVQVHDSIEGVEAMIDSFKSEVRAGAIELGGSKFGLSDPESLIGQFEEIAAKWEGLLADQDLTDLDALTELLAREIYANVDRSSYGLN